MKKPSKPKTVKIDRQQIFEVRVALACQVKSLFALRHQAGDFRTRCLAAIKAYRNFSVLNSSWRIASKA